jgi:hypothetical protein
MAAEITEVHLGDGSRLRIEGAIHAVAGQISADRAGPHGFCEVASGQVTYLIRPEQVVYLESATSRDAA